MHRTQFAAVLTAGAAGLVLAACNDTSDSSPTSPMVAGQTTAAVINCNNQTFNNARGFARTYFVNSGGQLTQNTAVGLIDAMQAASGPTADETRAEKGLDLFALAAAGVNVQPGEEAAGSSLLNIVGQCAGLMSADIDWTGALGPQGALAVVGDGSANENGPVYAKDLFSAVAPPGGDKDWSGWLRLPDLPDFPDARAVVFGAPFDVTPDLSVEAEIGERGFDWSVIPERDFPFGLEDDDDGFFGICVASSTTERVQNNHQSDNTIIPGILGSYEPGDPPLNLTCDGFDVDGQPLAPIGMLRRLIDLVTPRPAYAAALLGKKTGSTPGGFSRHFVVKPTQLKVTVGTISNTNVGANLNGNAGVKVTVRTIPPAPPSGPPPLGVPLQLAEITISIAGNLGQPAQFDGDKVGRTNEFGEVVFTGLKLFSAGGYTLAATVTDGGLTQDPVSGLSNQFHIKNRK